MAAPSVSAAAFSISPLYSRILSSFPKGYFRFSFAYGSGVKKQANRPVGDRPMVDMIFVVDDAAGFHAQNILRNPTHYSWLRMLGHDAVARVQKWPANIYFNTLVPISGEDALLKYGVVTHEDFINELLDWNHLYLSGRLHKPVEILQPMNQEISDAVRINLMSALHAAFLLLPEYFTERHLYKTIAALSYNGDFRMIFGEDKNKIKNIVDGGVGGFRRLYKPLIKALDDYCEVPEDGTVDQTCMQDMSTTTRLFHLWQLAKGPQQGLVRLWRARTLRRRQDTEDVLRALARHPDCAGLLQAVLRGIVFTSSAQQSLKGIMTAGFTKSVVYSSKKIKKMMASVRSAESA